MKRRKQLTEGERYQIATLKKAGASNKEIAVIVIRQIGVRTVIYIATCGELHKKRHKKYGALDKRGQICNWVSIDQRPDIVEEKSRIGDWVVIR